MHLLPVRTWKVVYLSEANKENNQEQGEKKKEYSVEGQEIPADLECVISAEQRFVWGVVKTYS